MRVNRRNGQRDQGFTLVEMLIVITILGILSGMVAFSVRAITDRGRDSSCRTDARTLEQAEEAYRARNDIYASEADLYAAGLLTSESELHDIDLVAGEFSLVPLSHCA